MKILILTLLNSICLFLFPLCLNAQAIKTYVIGTTNKVSPYQLFTDAATIGDFKAGEKIWITGINNEYFRSKDKNGRTVFTFKSNLINPDSLSLAFAKDLALIEKIEEEKRTAIIAQEKEAESKVKSYLSKSGSKIDKYCFNNKEIMIGMSELIFVWVKKEFPVSKNITKTRYGVDEQWVYPDNRYYYFTNKKLPAVQE